METLRETEKRYGSIAMAAAVVIGCLLIFSGFRPYGKGLIMGTIFSILNFVLMGETLKGRLGIEKRRAVFHSLGSILVRYLFMAVPIVVAIKFDKFDLYTVIVGLFMIQIIILAERIPVLIWAHRGAPVRKE